MCKFVIPTYGKCGHKDPGVIKSCPRGYNDTTKLCAAKEPIKPAVSYAKLPLCTTCRERIEAETQIYEKYDRLIELWREAQDENSAAEIKRCRETMNEELEVLRERFEKKLRVMGERHEEELEKLRKRQKAAGIIK